MMTIIEFRSFLVKAFDCLWLSLQEHSVGQQNSHQSRWVSEGADWVVVFLPENVIQGVGYHEYHYVSEDSLKRSFQIDFEEEDLYPKKWVYEEEDEEIDQRRLSAGDKAE